LLFDEGALPTKLEFKVGAFIPVEGFPPLHSAKEGRQPRFVFVRKPVLDILGLLDVHVPRGCWLQGAPGTGKSQTGRLWACREVCNGKQVTFGEVRDGTYWITTMHGKEWHQVSTDEKPFVEDLKNALKEDGIVVLAGVVQKRQIIVDLAAFMLKRKDTLVISSGQLDLKDEAPDFLAPGWSLEELQAAASNESFFDGTRLRDEVQFDDGREQFVLQKFEVCGGSARLMFERTLLSALNILNHALGLLEESDKKKVLFGTLSPHHDRAKNCLLQNFAAKGSYTPTDVTTSFLSKYVLSKLRDTLNMSDAKKLYATCAGLNRSMEGWAFEELVRQFFATKKENGSFRMKLRRVGVGEDEKQYEWNVINIADFTCVMESANMVDVFRFVDDINLDGSVDAWPDKWNFSTLDHLRLQKIGSVACVESRVLACPHALFPTQIPCGSSFAFKTPSPRSTRPTSTCC
jgi:hypothetical protein